MPAMSSLATSPPPPPAVAERPDGRPLAWIASVGGGATRRRKDDRLAAVLEEFGYRTHVADGAEDPLADGLGDAGLVVCDVVRPDVDLPVELTLAGMRGIPVLVLLPEGVPVDGLAGAVLADARATVVRYFRVEPHRALHERLVASTS